jgi:hypothetical protein
MEKKSDIISEQYSVPLVKFASLYAASYGLMFFFLDAMFWDDWYVNFTLNQEQTLQYWKDMLGFFPTNRFIEVFVLNRNPVAFHIVIFVSFFISGILLFQILKSIPGITEKSNVMICTLFLILPINSARVSMATIRLSYSLTIFLFAWFILVQNKHRRIAYLSLPLFFLSFLTQGLVPFFVLPCLHLFYINRYVNRRSAITAALKALAVLLSGAVYFTMMRLLDPPPAERIDYYTPTLSGLVRALLFLLVGIVVLWRSFKSYNLRSPEKFGGVQLIGLGVFSLSLGSFAYLASGRLMDFSEWILNFVPNASEWDSRHQLLLGLGFAMIISGFVDLLPENFGRSIFKVAVVFCLIFNLIFMRDYLLDWKKQTAIVENLRDLPMPSAVNVVMVHETEAAQRFNARGRFIRSFEWEALFEKGTSMKDVEIVYSGRIDCLGDRSQIPDTLMTIDALNSNMKAIVLRDPGIIVGIEKISPCGD